MTKRQQSDDLIRRLRTAKKNLLKAKEEYLETEGQLEALNQQLQVIYDRRTLLSNDDLCGGEIQRYTNVVSELTKQLRNLELPEDEYFRAMGISDKDPRPVIKWQHKDGVVDGIRLLRSHDYLDGVYRAYEVKEVQPNAIVFFANDYSSTDLHIIKISEAVNAGYNIKLSFPTGVHNFNDQYQKIG